MSKAFTIEVVSVTPPKHAPGQNGGYDFIELAYKDQGKINGKKLVSFTNGNVYKTFKDSKQGEVYLVTAEKDAKNYWQWSDARRGEGTPEAASFNVPPSPAPASDPVRSSGRGVSGSTYETPQERSRRQAMIVRQSSINTAVEVLKLDTSVPTELLTLEMVLANAQKIEDHIYEGLEARAKQYHNTQVD